MPVLTDVMSARIKENVRTIYGKVLTQPAQIVSDGVAVTYGCDVDIAKYDPTGQIDQYYRSLHGIPSEASDSPDKHPRNDEWRLEDALTTNTVLHNVPIARGNADLIYAGAGNAVELNRTANGKWEITGFALEQPGTYTLIPVDLGDITIGPVIDMSIDGRLLTFQELGTIKPFGELPFGGSGIFVGGTLLRVV